MTNEIFRVKLAEYRHALTTASWLELRDLLAETMPDADPALRIELSFVIRHLRNLVTWYATCAEEIARTSTDPGARLTALAALSLDDLRTPDLPDWIEERLRATRKRAWGDAVAPLRAPGRRQDGHGKRRDADEEDADA